VALAACGNKDEKPAPPPTQPDQPLSKSKNSIEFNASFSKMMDDYFHLKDNFITESDTIIGVYTKRMMADADSLKISELKGDTNVVATAKSLAQSISAELKGLSGEKDILQKRKSFNMLTDEVYNLIRTVQFDQGIFYHQHCPMAFENGDVNGFWLSRTSDIKNPYIPRKMLTCGDVVDSLDYRPK
jgi:hypothetical protein